MLAEGRKLVTRLKALADPARLRLLALCRHGECSVSELTAVVSLSQPRVSQQLKILCDAGLLERFRDGKRVYYRLAAGGADAAARRRLLSLLPVDEPQFDDDVERLRRLRGDAASPTVRDDNDRALHRAVLDLTVAEAVGDLLDIGCGRGSLLKLLASRANRAVGVDIDASARDLARAELLLAGLDNCSLRQGDMYRLPFADGEFDPVILDDVLAGAERPVDALCEARRQLRDGGRVLLLLRNGAGETDALLRDLAAWCAAARLRLAPARQSGDWLLAVGRPADERAVAA